MASASKLVDVTKDRFRTPMRPRRSTVDKHMADQIHGIPPRGQAASKQIAAKLGKTSKVTRIPLLRPALAGRGRATSAGQTQHEEGFESFGKRSATEGATEAASRSRRSSLSSARSDAYRCGDRRDVATFRKERPQGNRCRRNIRASVGARVPRTNGAPDPRVPRRRASPYRARRSVLLEGRIHDPFRFCQRLTSGFHTLEAKCYVAPMERDRRIPPVVVSEPFGVALVRKPRTVRGRELWRFLARPFAEFVSFEEIVRHIRPRSNRRHRCDPGRGLSPLPARKTDDRLRCKH